MHELSIATSILKTAENEVEKIKGKNVAEIFWKLAKFLV
jgi:Zn finger protein HypA/HybF involved in hydrogenase expression